MQIKFGQLYFRASNTRDQQLGKLVELLNTNLEQVQQPGSHQQRTWIDTANNLGVDIQVTVTPTQKPDQYQFSPQFISHQPNDRRSLPKPKTGKQTLPPSLDSTKTFNRAMQVIAPKVREKFSILRTLNS